MFLGPTFLPILSDVCSIHMFSVLKNMLDVVFEDKDESCIVWDFCCLVNWDIVGHQTRHFSWLSLQDRLSETNQHTAW